MARLLGRGRRRRERVSELFVFRYMGVWRLSCGPQGMKAVWTALFYNHTDASPSSRKDLFGASTRYRSVLQEFHAQGHGEYSDSDEVSVIYPKTKPQKVTVKKPND